MSRVIVLDTGPLGLLTNPKRTEETLAAVTWSIEAMAAGHRLVVPAVARRTAVTATLAYAA